MSLTLPLTLSARDKATVRTAAYGAVSLLAAADATGSPHRAATHGSVVLASATGPVGHVLAERTPDIELHGSSVAALADQVFPALTAAMTLLGEEDPAQAGAFRDTVLLAVEAAARTRKGGPGPAVAEMARKITRALDAA
ncbi:hypothetical protein [Streptomyces sp. NPDC017202]|uniref:hypothetical protein n=1 Tax=Streptomyces sp. NPDC017202 TaxID=3364981 RepID=UPI003788B32F